MKARKVAGSATWPSRSVFLFSHERRIEFVYLVCLAIRMKLNFFPKTTQCSFKEVEVDKIQETATRRTGQRIVVQKKRSNKNRKINTEHLE